MTLAVRSILSCDILNNRCIAFARTDILNMLINDAFAPSLLFVSLLAATAQGLYIDVNIDIGGRQVARSGYKTYMDLTAHLRYLAQLEEDSRAVASTVDSVLHGSGEVSKASLSFNSPSVWLSALIRKQVEDVEISLGTYSAPLIHGVQDEDPVFVSCKATSSFDKRSISFCHL